CVPGLMTQDTHEPAGIAALYLTHDASFKLLQAWVSKIERHGDSRHAVRREPLFREPDVRPHGNATALELRVEAIQSALQMRALDRNRQIAKTQRQELFVRQPCPGRPRLGQRAGGFLFHRTRAPRGGATANGPGHWNVSSEIVGNGEVIKLSKYASA